MSDYLRGHKIERVNGEWIYSDTKEPTIGNRRDCGYCGLADTKEGYDGCIGELPDVMNACCGHGMPKDAYIQFNDGLRMEGVSTLLYMNMHVLEKLP